MEGKAKKSTKVKVAASAEIEATSGAGGKFRLVSKDGENVHVRIPMSLQADGPSCSIDDLVATLTSIKRRYVEEVTG